MTPGMVSPGIAARCGQTWTASADQRRLEAVTEPDRDQLIAQVAADAADLLTTAQRERARLQAAGADAAVLDQLLPELTALAEQTRDLDTFCELRAVVDVHGIGPYPLEDLAAIAGTTVDDARRVLEQMVAEGLAAPVGEPPDRPA
jgi:hypothetical protein